MADKQRQYVAESGEAGTCTLTVTFTVGATGAVPAALTRQKGIASVVRNGVGDYTVNLSERWLALLSASATVVGATSSTTGKSYDVITNSVNAAAPLVRYQMLANGAGTAAEVAQNDVLTFTIVVKGKSPL